MGAHCLLEVSTGSRRSKGSAAFDRTVNRFVFPIAAATDRPRLQFAEAPPHPDSEHWLIVCCSPFVHVQLVEYAVQRTFAASEKHRYFSQEPSAQAAVPVSTQILPRHPASAGLVARSTREIAMPQRIVNRLERYGCRIFFLLAVEVV